MSIFETFKVHKKVFLYKFCVKRFCNALVKANKHNYGVTNLEFLEIDVHDTSKVQPFVIYHREIFYGRETRCTGSIVHHSACPRKEGPEWLRIVPMFIFQMKEFDIETNRHKGTYWFFSPIDFLFYLESWKMQALFMFSNIGQNHEESD